VLFGPDSATYGGVVDVGHGRHKALHGLIESVAFPLPEDRHLALVKIVDPETVKHNHHSSLEGTLFVLALQDSSYTRGHGSGCPILEHCPAARSFDHGFLQDSAPDTRYFFGGLIPGPKLKLNRNIPFDFLVERHVTRTRVCMQCNTPARAVIA